VNCDEKEKTLEKLERLKNLVIEKLLQPEKFNLVPPKE
jgi:hypothetical protein